MRKTMTTLSLACLFLGFSSMVAADWDAGVEAFKSGNYKQAAAEFQTVVDQQPDFPGGHLMLGQSLMRDKQAAQAVPHLRRALELNPGDVNTQLVLGQALYQTGKYRETTQVLAQINASSLPKSQQAALYKMRGGAYQKIGQDDTALSDLQKAAQLLPSDGGAQFAYGAAALKAGQTEAAVAALEKAMALDPKEQVIKTYVQALVRQGRLSKGAQKNAAYNKAASAAKRLPASFDNLLLLGEVELGAKTYDSAIATLQKASAKKSSDWLPYYYIGQAHTAKGTYAQAESPLNNALSHTSSTTDQKKIWRQLGYVYEKQKKFDAAISAYQKAGDAGGERRVADNKKIAEENLEADEHNRRIQELEAERQRLKEEMEALPGGAPPR